MGPLGTYFKSIDIKKQLLDGLNRFDLPVITHEYNMCIVIYFISFHFRRNRLGRYLPYLIIIIIYISLKLRKHVSAVVFYACASMCVCTVYSVSAYAHYILLFYIQWSNLGERGKGEAPLILYIFYIFWGFLLIIFLRIGEWQIPTLFYKIFLLFLFCKIALTIQNYFNNIFNLMYIIYYNYYYHVTLSLRRYGILYSRF